MARRVEKSIKKTSATRKPSPIELHPELRGRGPKKGAPNAGRPPSAIRASMRLALDQRIHVLAQIADDPNATPIERMKAIDLLGKYGMGTTITETDTDGQDVARPVLVVPMTGSATDWAAATQTQQAELEAKKRALAEAHGVG